jgi:hypothetical protein
VKNLPTQIIYRFEGSTRNTIDGIIRDFHIFKLLSFRKVKSIDHRKVSNPVANKIRIASPDDSRDARLYN